MDGSKQQRITKAQIVERDKILRDMAMANCTTKEMQQALKEQLGINIYGREIAKVRAELQLKRPYRRRAVQPAAPAEPVPAPAQSPAQPPAAQPQEGVEPSSLLEVLNAACALLRARGHTSITIHSDGRFETVTRGSVEDLAG